MIKICLICNKRFKTNNNRKKYCSIKCRKKAEYLRNREKYLKGFKEYNEKNKNQIKIQRHEHYLENRERILKEKQDYYLENKESITEYKRNWAKKNRKKINARMRRFIKENINYRLSAYLRNRLNKVLKDNIKSASVTKLIGCSLEELKRHLESQFKPGMNWNNYGEWHIDHKVACCKFDLSKPEEQKRCFGFQNLQPLWAKENLSKNRY